MSLKVEELVEGYEISTETSFTQQQVTDYVTLVHDSNPIHTNVDFAREKGFEGTIVPGGLVEGTLVGLASSQFPFGAFLVEKTFRFKIPLYVGRPVLLIVKIDEVLGNEERKVIKLSAKATHDEKIYVEGKFTGFYQAVTSKR